MLAALARRIDHAFTARTELASLEARERVLRHLDSITNAMTGLGGANDKGAAATPDTSRLPMNKAQLDALYRFNGYAARIIDAIPDDATRKGWRVVDNTQEQAVLEEEDKRLHIRSRVADWITAARKDGGALLLIVTEEELTEERWSLAQPLDPTKVKEVKALHVIERAEASVCQWESNPKEGHWRRARTWMISPMVASSGWDDYQGYSGLLLGGSVEVHRSRVLYLGGRKLPNSLRLLNGGWDDSILEGYWDKIRNRESIDQAGAILAQEVKQDVLKVEGLEKLSLGDQAETFDLRTKAMAKAKSLLNMIIIGGGEQFETRYGNVSGFKELDQASKDSLSAVTSLPQVKLWGEAPGGLNTDGESHRNLWNEFISAFQNDELREPLEYLYALLFHVTQGNPPEDWNLIFNALDELTEQQLAELEKTTAEVDAIYIGAGVYTPGHVTRSRFGEKGWKRELLPVEEEPEEQPENAEDMPADDPGVDLEATPAGAGEVQDTALNGAQVESMRNTLLSVAMGELPEETAIIMLMVAFRISREEAASMVRPAAAMADEAPPKPEPTQPPPFGQPPQPPMDDQEPEDDEGQDEEE